MEAHAELLQRLNKAFSLISPKATQSRVSLETIPPRVESIHPLMGEALHPVALTDPLNNTNKQVPSLGPRCGHMGQRPPVVLLVLRSTECNDP